MTEEKKFAMIDRVNRSIETHTRRLNDAHRLKELLLGLPEEILAMDGDASLSFGNELRLSFNGGDLTYATLYDLGFDFPVKPEFNEYIQTFSRRGKRQVDMPVHGVIHVSASVSEITKPPSCEIVETKEMEEVIHYKAICAEDGEEL